MGRAAKEWQVLHPERCAALYWTPQPAMGSPTWRRWMRELDEHCPCHTNADEIRLEHTFECGRPIPIEAGGRKTAS